MDLVSCPGCGDCSPNATWCDRCDRALGDGPAGGDGAALRRRLTVGACLGAVHGLAAAVALGLGMYQAESWWSRSAVTSLQLGAIPAVLFVAVGAWIGRRAEQTRLLVGERALRERYLLSRWSSVPLRRVADVGDGPVRLLGYARAVAPTTTAQGLPCVASESLGDEVGAGVTATGGVFELVDRHGDAVWVDARHVAVLQGLEFDNERNVPPGAMIELYGHARRSDEGLSDAVSGYRASAGCWVVGGRRDDPVVLRMVG